MLLFDTTQLALQRAIGGAAQRHQALATNLANANTPGFQRVDVDFHTSLARAMATDDSAAVQRTTFAAQRDGFAAARADGNSVDAESESAKMAANALEQQAAIQVAAARTMILKSAMGVA